MARQGVYQQTGNIIDFLNTTNDIITAGQVVPMTTRIGFAVADIAPGAVGGVAVKGVFADVPAETTAAFSVGESLFWNAAGNKLTKTATDNTPIGGWCAMDKAKTGSNATIKLIG